MIITLSQKGGRLGVAGSQKLTFLANIIRAGILKPFGLTVNASFIARKTMTTINEPTLGKL